ncbi:Methyltransferase domain-containing protein [Clostridium cavendishii DSM 21758]|uniref:Methyltransferase domain-containing protein n=1 Tax=Clostridium cavendishii DSM 21758 TaxID=1121302 RepID=A0A1M6R6Q4_9CLOT|nr:class I SAM-dependent methyltransferase [Clostridium cavendishii]SHK28106.1 Methyltransferase domain-containing protein [Clostridium cavendishii DSM 21758]
MRTNKYDDKDFFDEYKKMNRSVNGLKGAGEWQMFRKMIPELEDKKVLDLGCGFGWHCKYCIENKAKLVVGVDSSERMLEEAKKTNTDVSIDYIKSEIEHIEFPRNYFDVVISSLVFHYIENFNDICKKVYECMVPGGDFIFSVEHPIFTAYGNQEWYCDELGNRVHWPVDRYFDEGIRKANFLGKEVIKYHKTLTTYINTLLNCGFKVKEVIEPKPPEEMLRDDRDMQDELRRPMMLLISARKDK